MKRVISMILILGMALSFDGVAASASDDDGSDSSAGSALGSALMGGLLGAGLGAAIGSASGKAGTGAAIGAGIGAVGGTLMGAQAEKNKRARQAQEDAYYVEEAPQPVVRQEAATADVKPKRRVIREFDDQGNVISEKEINQ